MTISKRTRFIDDEQGLEYRFEPIEDSLKVAKTKEGYTARYIIQDKDPSSPEEWGDDGMFLVGYHRDFSVDRGSYERKKKVIFRPEEFKKDDGYGGRAYADGYGWMDLKEAKAKGLFNKEVTERGKYVPGISKDLARAIALNDKENEEAQDYIKKYHIFPLEAYIHSGVSLALGGEGNFPDRQWDVSQLGLVFIAKDEAKDRKKARKMAQKLIETWNTYLSGDVYCIVEETYNKDKEPLSYDICSGYYGYQYAKEEV